MSRCPTCGNEIKYGSCYVCSGIERDRKRSGGRLRSSNKKRRERQVGENTQAEAISRSADDDRSKFSSKKRRKKKSEKKTETRPVSRSRRDGRSITSRRRRHQRQSLRSSAKQISTRSKRSEAKSNVALDPTDKDSARTSLGVYLSSDPIPTQSGRNKSATEEKVNHVTRVRPQAISNNRQMLLARLGSYNRLFAGIYARSGMSSLILRSLHFSENDISRLKHDYAEEYVNELDRIGNEGPLKDIPSIERAVAKAANIVLNRHNKEHSS